MVGRFGVVARRVVGVRLSLGRLVAIIAGVSQDLIDKGLSAKAVANAAASIVGGGGGGRDDLAQAGGRDASKLPEAFESVRALVRETVGG